MKVYWLVGVAWLVGCAAPPAESGEVSLEVPDAVEIDDVPTNEDEFFAEFAPLPAGPVTVDYDVRGPGGMAGAMSITLADGARRAESWTLTMPMPGREPVVIEGSAVHTPRWSWSAAAEGSAEQVPRPLGALAKAFFEADETQRRAVIEHVRRWHDEVDAGRVAHPGTVDAVAGQTCLRTLTAGQSLCVWEATGLPLDYRSEAFVVSAREIRRDVEVGASTFRIPAGAQVRASSSFDADAVLERLSEGNLAELPRLMQSRRLGPA